MPAPSPELLQRVPLFAALERDDLQSLLRSLKERTFSEGATIAKEGERGIGFFVIDEGQARVTVHGDERGVLGPGDYFGDLALIDDEGARTATVTAASNLRCYGLTSWEFRPLVEGNARLAWKLLQAVAKRLRDAEQRHG